jgi:sugar fermentation stimulation protein A
MGRELTRPLEFAAIFPLHSFELPAMLPLPPLTTGTLIRRYKRFLADVELPGAGVVTAHCPNTGSMESCWKPGAPVRLSYSDNPKRKLAWTLECVDMGHGWVGVNTSRVNRAVRAAVEHGVIDGLRGYTRIRGEPRVDFDGHPASRFDLLLEKDGGRECFVEIKNTTLLVGDSVRFPDAITERGRKHLELLALAVARGARGVILFAVNRPEGRWFEPAADIDPEYARTLTRVLDAGVEVIAARLRHGDSTLEVTGSVHITR